MTDRPIIFSKPMVLALLREANEQGTGKSQTRRLAWSRIRLDVHHADGPTLQRRGWDCIASPGNWFETWGRQSSWQRAEAGDRLWVRENLAVMGNWGVWHDAGDVPRSGQFLDDLDERGRALLDRYAPAEATDSARIPSIHMPRWASRLTLTVTGMKTERLQDITDQDCEREGVVYDHVAGEAYVPGLPREITAVGSVQMRFGPMEVVSFSKLWNHINGAGAWEANPEVVAVSFTVALRNIDAVTA